MNEEELNKLDIKLGEWAGVVHFGLKFTQDETACFKWLVPKLNELGLRIHMMSQPRGRKDFFCSIGGKWCPHECVYAETLALALCLAIEKLIDEEKK